MITAVPLSGLSGPALGPYQGDEAAGGKARPVRRAMHLADRLQDLDPTGTLINCAVSNQRDLADKPFSESIASDILDSSTLDK